MTSFPSYKDPHKLPMLQLKQNQTQHCFQISKQILTYHYSSWAPVYYFYQLFSSSQLLWKHFSSSQLFFQLICQLLREQLSQLLLVSAQFVQHQVWVCTLEIVNLGMVGLQKLSSSLKAVHLNLGHLFHAYFQQYLSQTPLQFQQQLKRHQSLVFSSAHNEILNIFVKHQHFVNKKYLRSMIYYLYL